MPEGDDVNAVGTRETVLPAGDDAEGGDLRLLGFRQPGAKPCEVGDGLRDRPFPAELHLDPDPCAVSSLDDRVDFEIGGIAVMKHAGISSIGVHPKVSDRQRFEQQPH